MSTIVDQLEDSLREKYKDVLECHANGAPMLDLMPRLESNAFELKLIQVKKSERGSGHGGKIMEEICDFADKHNLVVVLSPSEIKTAKLIKWYKTFDFHENKNRNKDFRFMSRMIRYPHGMTRLKWIDANPSTASVNEWDKEAEKTRSWYQNCRMFVQHLTGASDIEKLPRVKKSDLQEGDILWWGTAHGYLHVAVYIGNGMIWQVEEWGAQPEKIKLSEAEKAFNKVDRIYRPNRVAASMDPISQYNLIENGAGEFSQEQLDAFDKLPAMSGQNGDFSREGYKFYVSDLGKTDKRGWEYFMETEDWGCLYLKDKDGNEYSDHEDEGTEMSKILGYELVKSGECVQDMGYKYPFVYCTDSSDNMIGFAIAGDPEIIGNYVDHKHRRKGIATQMHKELEKANGKKIGPGSLSEDGEKLWEGKEQKGVAELAVASEWPSEWYEYGLTDEDIAYLYAVADNFTGFLTEDMLQDFTGVIYRKSESEDENHNLFWTEEKWVAELFNGKLKELDYSGKVWPISRYLDENTGRLSKIEHEMKYDMGHDGGDTLNEITELLESGLKYNENEMGTVIIPAGKIRKDAIKIVAGSADENTTSASNIKIIDASTLGRGDEQLLEKTFTLVEESYIETFNQNLEFIALDSGEPVGVITCEEGGGELSIVVAPDHQRQGIAEQLVKRLIEKAKKHHYEFLLAVPVNNESRKLFTKMGFVGRGGDLFMSEDAIQAVAQICEGKGLVIPDKHNLGVPRRNMPQIKKKHMGKFIDFLESEGVEIKETEISLKKLKPTQKEFNTQKIHLMMNEDKHKLSKPLLVSKDNYILDGHHKWLAQLNMDDSKKAKCLQVDLDAEEFLKKAKEFSKVRYRDLDDNEYKSTDPNLSHASIKGDAFDAYCAFHYSDDNSFVDDHENDFIDYVSKLPIQMIPWGDLLVVHTDDLDFSFNSTLDKEYLSKNFKSKEDFITKTLKEPIMVLEEKGKRYVLDGQHRLATHINRGSKTVPAVIFKLDGFEGGKTKPEVYRDSIDSLGYKPIKTMVAAALIPGKEVKKYLEKSSDDIVWDDFGIEGNTYELRQVKLTDIENVEMRGKDEEICYEYAQRYLNTGSYFPPIVLAGSKPYQIIYGFHRLYAARQTELDSIEAYVPVKNAIAAAKYPNIIWKLPTWEDESVEFARLDETKDWQKLFEKAKRVGLKTLSAEQIARIENTDYHKIHSLDEAQELATEYDRNIGNILAGVMSKSPIPAPVLLRKGQGYYLVGGNTRMMVCKAIGKTPKFIIVEEAVTTASNSKFEKALEKVKEGYESGIYTGYLNPIEYENELREDIAGIVGKPIYRAVKLDHENKLDKKNVGIYWTWDKDKAVTYWGHEGNCVVSLESEATDDNVDWEATIEQWMKPQYNGECEVRLKPKAEVEVTNVWVNKIKKEKKFKAVAFQEDTLDSAIGLLALRCDYPNPAKIIHNFKKYRLTPDELKKVYKLHNETFWDHSDSDNKNDDLSRGGALKILKENDEPVVVKYRGKLYALDGQHRMNTAIVLNTALEVKVCDLDYVKDVDFETEGYATQTPEFPEVLQNEAVASASVGWGVVWESWKKNHTGEVSEHTPELKERVKEHASYTLKQIPLNEIKFVNDVPFDPSVALNVKEDEEWAVEKYAPMKTKAPPVIAVRKSGGYSLIDGRHRTRAAFLRGDTTILAYVADNVASSEKQDKITFKVLYAGRVAVMVNGEHVDSIFNPKIDSGEGKSRWYISGDRDSDGFLKLQDAKNYWVSDIHPSDKWKWK